MRVLLGVGINTELNFNASYIRRELPMTMENLGFSLCRLLSSDVLGGNIARSELECFGWQN